MATDGVFTVTSPTYPGENVATAFDEIKENFEWIRRFIMNGGAPPIHGATLAYGYDGSNRLSTITFGGTLAGSAAFTYDGSNQMTTEVWTLYSKTITYTHTYSTGQITGTTVSIA
jgi:hypothetical protein